MEKDIQSIYQNFKDNLSMASFKPSKALQDVIYHYTSSEGLFGILSKGILRATNYSYLNDSSEVKYGSEIVKEVIEYYLKEEKQDLKVKFLHLLNESFLSKTMLSDLYVSCFSKNGNQLSQWRTYGLSSGRFSIGFNVENLQTIRSNNFSLGNVNYDIEYQKQEIKDKISIAFKSINSLEHSLKPYILNNDTGKILEPFSEYLTNILMNKICFFKDPTFNEENEVRAIYWIEDTKDSKDEMNFYITNNNIKPYIKLITGELNDNYPLKLPIYEIYVGPSSNQDQLSKTINMMLYKFGYNDVTINYSKIPLR